MKKHSLRRRKRPARPDPVDDLNTAIQLLEQGDLAKAETSCRRVLATEPKTAQALHLLGLIDFRRGNCAEAVELLRRAIRCDECYLLAYNDLGNMLHEQGDFSGAIATYSKLNDLQPDDPRTLNNLGVTLKDDDQIEEAIAILERAVELDPEYLSAQLNLGYAHQKNESLAQAIEAFERAAKIDPSDLKPLRVLSHLYRQVGNRDQVLEIYRRWLALEPDNPIAQHMVIANSSTPPPARAADDFVRQEFDRFADSFDDKLNLLGYRAPELVCDLVTRRLFNHDHSLVVLDAGCGTGLGGVLLRPFAKRLVGVDLSPGMLDKARLRSVYDELVEMELGAYLEQNVNEFELITVIDTIIYFGDLLPPLTACAAALRKGGNIAFTVETHSDSQTDFVLDGTGRYQHTEDYVQKCLTLSGFTDCEIASVILREENDEPVSGFLVWAHID